VSDFNIESLLDFSPAKYWCANCYALFSEKTLKSIKTEAERRKDWIYICPCCSIKYIHSSASEYLLDHYFTEYLDHTVKRPFPYDNEDLHNTINHIQRLALIAKQIKSHKTNYSPLRGLFEALLQAKSFMHFTSYGISQFMIGALKVASQNVDIRGIVAGNSGENMICETTDYKNDAPRLTIQWLNTGEYRSQDVPHQKLVVIDGLLAFKGSTNLTQTGWRSAQKNMDILEVVTNVNEVINFHNRYFSSVWAKSSDQEEMDLDDMIPF